MVIPLNVVNLLFIILMSKKSHAGTQCRTLNIKLINITRVCQTELKLYTSEGKKCLWLSHTCRGITDGRLVNILC